MLTKLLGAIVISVASVITTLLVQSVIGFHGTSAAGRPHQTTATPQPCKAGAVNGTGVVGTVSSVNGNTIAVKTPGGTTVTVTVSSSTTYRGPNGNASLSDIHTGTVVAARGTRSGNNLTAREIMVIPPHAAGKVTKIDGSTITVQPPSGPWGKLASSVTTIVTTGSTKYFSFGAQNPGLSSIKVGSYIAAEGSLSADGKTLTATQVMIAPAAFNPGSGNPHRFFGMRTMPGGMFGQWRAQHMWNGAPTAPMMSSPSA